MSGGGAAGEGMGGHPDFGMGGVAPEGDSGFGQDRSFGDNVSAAALAANPQLQHDIAQVQLGYNVPGYAGLLDDEGRKAMVDKARHAMAVRSLTKAGLSPSMAKTVMDAREALTDASPRDFASNAAAAAILDANPNATMADMASAIGSGAFDNAANPMGGGGAWGVNPKNSANTTATPTGSFNVDLSPAFDIFGTPAILGIAKNAKTLSPSSLGALSVLGAIEAGKFGMGLVADAMGIPESVRNVPVEGKGELSGAGVYSGPDMDLNFQGLGPDMDLNFKGMESVSVDPIGSAILDLDRAFASNYDNPAAYNQSVIDALGKVSANTAAISKAGGDPRQAVIQREIAQKAAEQLIAQEAARNNNVVNIPVAGGPAVNVKITKAPKRPKSGKEAANYIDPGPSPAQIAAASLAANQAEFKKLPPRIQEELRSGRQPTGSDRDVDRAMAIINPPKPSSPMDSRGR